MDVMNAEAVEKRYGDKAALRGVTLSVRKGEILALVGPNGAGKTTLIRIVAGLLRPDGGEVRVCGHSVATELSQVRGRIGLLPQDSLPDPQANAWEHVYYYLWARMRNRRKAARAAEEALREVDLWERRHVPAMKLSGGYQRRILLAMALGARPTLLLLDEPAAALDPTARHELWNRLAAARRAGGILLTTHDMAEAESLGDRVALIADGRIVACEPPDHLLRLLPTAEKVTLDAVPSSIPLEKYGTVRQVAGRPVLYPEDAAATRTVVELLARDHVPFATRRITLEDAYLHILSP